MNAFWKVLLLSGLFATSSIHATTVSRPPIYPVDAAEQCIEGEVTLGFVVGPEGNPKAIEVLSAEPENVFDEAAVTALSRFYIDKPPGMESSITIEFSLESCENRGS